MQEIIKTSTIDINLINFQNEHSTIDLQMRKFLY